MKNAPSFNHHQWQLWLLMMIFVGVSAKAQTSFKGLEHLFTTPESYVVYYTKHPPVIDGDINKSAWQQAAWTNLFQDIEGKNKPKPQFDTKVKMLWDDSCLYIASQITEPHVWATLKHHDEIIYYDNDFEVFLNPNNTTQPYFEIETNALNTVFDLLLNKPYRNGGAAIISWDVKGLRSAVKIQGTLNNSADVDEGWTIEMAIPFKSISVGNFVRVPQEGTLWRINFSRVEWDTKVVNGKYQKQKDSTGKSMPEHNWVWSAQGIVDMHYPERWGYLQFSKQVANSVIFTLPYAELQKQYLWLVYYRQQQWFSTHQRYAGTLSELGIDDMVNIQNKSNKLSIEATPHTFLVSISDSGIPYYIDQTGLVQHPIIRKP